MVTRVVGKLIVNALALIAAGLLVPHFHVDLHDSAGNVGATNVVYVAVLAIIFAVINTFIRPIAKLASLPLNLLTLGLFGFVVNGVLVLLLAFAAGQLQSHPYAMRLGEGASGFPPNISVDALVGAVLGAIVISIVSTGLALFVPDR